MKLVVIIATSVFVLLIIGYFAYFGEEKQRVCYVNINRVFEGYLGMKDRKLEFKKESKLWQDTLDILYKRIVDEQRLHTNKNQEVTDPSVLEQIRIYNRYKEMLELRNVESQDKITKEIVTQVKSFSSVFAKRYNYDLVIASDQFGTIFYSSPEVDKTELLLSELNTYYNGKKNN